MRHFIGLFLVLVFSCQLSALAGETDSITPKNGKVILDFHVGYSAVFGKYSDNTNTKLSGYAANGFSLQAGGSWISNSGIGLGVAYCYQNNPLQSGFSNDTLIDMYESLGSKHWNNHYLIAGPVFIKVMGNWLLTLKAQAGGVLSYSPLFKIWMPSTDSLYPTNVTLSDGPGFGVAFQALAGIGYRITDNFFVNLAFSYLGANPSRTKEYSTYDMETDPQTQETRYVYIQGERTRKKKISSFNISLGIAVNL